MRVSQFLFRLPTGVVIEKACACKQFSCDPRSATGNLTENLSAHTDCSRNDERKSKERWDSADFFRGNRKDFSMRQILAGEDVPFPCATSPRRLKVSVYDIFDGHHV